MTYSREELINALCAEWEYLCHDDFDPETDLTPDEYREHLKKMEYRELVEETSTDQYFTLEEYMDRYL